MEFRILGPLEAVEADRRIHLGEGKQQLLLAVLLLHANETLTSDRLIEELWGEHPPRSAQKALHFYVSRLRKVIEPPSEDGVRRLLVTRGSSYQLDLEPGQLDLQRFEKLLEAAERHRREGQLDRASLDLRRSLDLWRGPPLDGLSFEGAAQASVRHLEERRLTVLEDWIDLEVALGRHSTHVPELSRLAAEYPLRERLRAQLMLALYRSGRQADALEAYRQIRSVLIEELGIEPGLPLQRLERAILEQDPSLERPAGEPAVGGASPSEAVRGAPAPPRGPRRPPRWIYLVALAVAALAVPLVLALMLLAPDSAGDEVARQLPVEATQVAPDSVVAIDAGGGVVDAVFPVGTLPQAVAVSGGSAWAANLGDRTISRLDLKTIHVTTNGVGIEPKVLAADDSHIWVGDAQGAISRIDTAGASITAQEVPGIRGAVGDAAAGVMEAGHGSLWLGASQPGRVWRIDSMTGEIVATLEGIAPVAMAATADALWVLERGGTSVVRIDPRTNAVVARVPIRGGTELGAGEGAVWVLDPTARQLWRIDPRTNRVATNIPLESTPRDSLVTGAGMVWVTQGPSGQVVRIDPKSNRIVGAVALSHVIRPHSIAFGGGLVWVAVGGPV